MLFLCYGIFVFEAPVSIKGTCFFSSRSHQALGFSQLWRARDLTVSYLIHTGLQGLAGIILKWSEGPLTRCGAVSNVLVAEPRDWELARDHMVERDNLHKLSSDRLVRAVAHEQPSTKQTHDKYINAYRTAVELLIPSLTTVVEPWTGNTTQTPSRHSLHCGQEPIFCSTCLQQSKSGRGKKDPHPHPMNAAWLPPIGNSNTRPLFKGCGLMG